MKYMMIILLIGQLSLLLGCNPKIQLAIGSPSQAIVEELRSSVPDTPIKKTSTPCVLRMNMPDRLCGREDSLMSRANLANLYFYSAKVIFEQAFQEALFKFFRAANSGELDSFIVEVNVPLSQLTINKKTANYKVHCEVVLRSHQERVILTCDLDGNTSSPFNGKEAPQAVWEGAYKLAYDYLKTISTDPRVHTAIKKHGQHREDGRMPSPPPDNPPERKPVRMPRANCWAVVIGLSEYANSGQNGLSNLVYADDDAEAFADSLKQQGWSDSHIKLLINEQATHHKIRITLDSWLTKAGPDDMITLFWSGHGFPDPEDPEKVYFACYDTDIRIPATGYRMDRVRSTIEERGCRNVVMLADTCHAGKLITRGDERAIGITPYVNSLVKKKNVPKGWVFMVASDVDRKAVEDSSWSHGAFTHCLLKGLNGAADGYQSAGAKDGIVTMGELKAFMNSAMPDETQKVLGVAKRPIITTSTGDPGIWNLSLTGK